jgi:hypothetical protein
VIQLAALVDRGLAQVIAIIKIGRCRHVLHYSKLSIAGCTVTFICLIDGVLESFSDLGRDVLEGDCTIVNKGHYNLSFERRKLALFNCNNAVKAQIGDCWLIRFDNLGLVWAALGYGQSIAVTRVKISLQVAISCAILQIFVVPQESVWRRQQRWHFVETEAVLVAATTALSHNRQLNRQVPSISEASNLNYVGLGNISEKWIAVASNQNVVA